MQDHRTRFEPHLCQFKLGLGQVSQVDSWFETIQSTPCLAFVGRSNVGKSSLLNGLMGIKIANTSKTPGRTREINVFEIQLRREQQTYGPFYLYDLPGYGYAKVSKSQSEQWDILLEHFFANLPNSTLLINIQDARHPLQKVDLQFLEFSQIYDGPITLVLNKADKLKSQKDRAKLRKQRQQIKQQFAQLNTIHTVSAEKRSGLPELGSDLIEHLLQ